MDELCQATTRNGERCSLPASNTGYCHVHDPDLRLQKQQRQIEEEENAKLEAERLRNQLQQIDAVIGLLEVKQNSYQDFLRKHDVLTSVVNGLYLEIEKLTKKAPAEQITDLALEQINDVITGTKELMQDDTYIQKLKVFVPAGDMPELRDALLVISQVRQGLARYDRKRDVGLIKEQISEAKMLRSALQMELKGSDPSSILKALKQNPENRSTDFLERWKTDTLWGESKFDFTRLDSLDLLVYFGVQQVE